MTLEEYNAYFGNIYVNTISTKLRDFQYRRLNIGYMVTNVALKEWNIITNENCTFCNLVSEEIPHLFYYCRYVKTVIDQLKEHIVSLMPDVTTNFALHNFIFNTVCRQPRHIINLLTLIVLLQCGFSS